MLILVLLAGLLVLVIADFLRLEHNRCLALDAALDGATRANADLHQHLATETKRADEATAGHGEALDEVRSLCEQLRRVHGDLAEADRRHDAAQTELVVARRRNRTTASPEVIS